uniref:Tectonic family member 1 n=1 Tax=Leptobrachium leishanense TaxID=445787 RepID=A0A8C5MYD4_9ANUR
MAPVMPWFIFFLVWCVAPSLTETPHNDTHLDVTEAEEWEDAAISLLNETSLAEGTALYPPNTERQHTPLYSTTADPGITTGNTRELPDQGDPLSTPADTQGTSKVSAVTRPPLLVKDSGLPVQSRAAALPSPITNVSSLCVCDLLVERCDVNCCCDPVCTASDFSVFSGCSVTVVTSNSRLCVQDSVLYSINSSSAIPQRVVQNVKIINPDVFCVQTANYQPAFSFITPDIATQNNFDSLLKEFGGLSFNTAINTANSVGSTAARTASRYTYGAAILTPDSFFKLPASLGTNTCTDSNPIGFLVSQDLKCSRNIAISNCSVGALALGTYKDIVILSVPNSQSAVNITINVTSITLQSINGTLTPVIPGEFIPSFDEATQICKFVALSGSYLVTYSDQGTITNITASFTLGAINSSMVPIQQSFKIRFTEEGKNTSSLSGNPGYIVGLPLVAGFKLPQSGIIQSTNRFNQLTILKSSTTQDCLAEDGNRATVLFGHNMLSGCTLRYSMLNSTCQLAADVVLNVLRGQQFPGYVAMFGNSQPENVLDWVPITYISTTQRAVSCYIPVSLALEVRWTKYGSFINPQAKIVNVTQTISHVLIPEHFYGSKKLLQITASVSFVDVSAPAQPGYKAQPTLDAKLPFDFFYPFV